MGFFFVSITFIVILALISAIAKQNKLKRLRAEYNDALLGTDKRVALLAGRAYYSALRQKSIFDKGHTTTVDEQAITNDMNTMMMNSSVTYSS